MVGGVAVFGMALATVGAYRSWTLERGVAAALRRALADFGPEYVPDHVVAAFTREFVEKWGHRLSALERAGARAYPMIAPLIQTLPEAAHAPIQRKFSNFENNLVPLYFRSTNILYRERGVAIEFYSVPAYSPFECSNPIARFDFAD